MNGSPPPPAPLLTLQTQQCDEVDLADETAVSPRSQYEPHG